MKKNKNYNKINKINLWNNYKIQIKILVNWIKKAIVKKHHNKKIIKVKMICY
jgi:hypothetical protein